MENSLITGKAMHPCPCLSLPPVLGQGTGERTMMADEEVCMALLLKPRKVGRVRNTKGERCVGADFNINIKVR